MEVTVLGYTGKIREGSSGFYVDFDNYAQEHWTTVGLIAQKYSLLRDNTDPDSDANWKPLFSRLKHVDFGIVYMLECRFPEFKDTAGLLKFISLLNNGLKEPDTNFINLDYIV